VGYYSITFSLQSSDGSQLPSLTLSALIAQPGSLLALFNNTGISDDSNPEAANFDGGGFSYSAQQLAQDGYTPGATVTVNGISYIWPPVPVAIDDNVTVSGQTIDLPHVQAGASQLTFLGSATSGPSEGTITITYTDGTKQTAQLGLSDWTLNADSQSPSYNNVIAARTPYRNSASGMPDQTVTYVFATAPIQLDTSKQVASITLPSSVNQGTLHVFAAALS
jgi:hypothetical protein